MDNWRFYIIIILLGLSIIDLTLTFIYIKLYKTWQPQKPYNLIESNPLLVFLFNNLGLVLGMFVGAVVILTLIYVVGKGAHWVVVALLLCVLMWVMYNHFHNFGLLNKLIEQYPNGVLPESIFGVVAGNNKIPQNK